MVIIDGKVLDRTFKFPGGEINVNVSGVKEKVNLVAKIRSSDDLMELLLVSDALKRNGSEIKSLTIPYIPYARQDRVCNPGEALSIKVFASLINGIKVKKVIGWDVHSDVTSALIDNFENIPVWDIISTDVVKNKILISPDAGALKKVFEVQKKFGNTRLITASKKRDVKTGDIINTEISCPIGGHYLIIDDICDGGRTFIELAKKIKNNNPESISLWVTHGIFSKGIDVFDGLIDYIYTTDSFCQIEHKKLTIKERLLCIETDQPQL